MADHGTLDPGAILAALGQPAPGAVERILGGADAATWRVGTADGDRALRVLGTAQGEQARREVAALRAAGAGGVPTPTVLAAGAWEGRPALLTTWVGGRTLLDEVLANPRDLRLVQVLAADVGRVQAAIHGLRLPAELAAGPVAWQGWADPSPALRACLARVPPRSPVLVHLDLHPRNVLVAGSRVTAVLDWGNARAGDPRADIARTLSIVRAAPLPPGPEWVAAVALLRVFEVSWRRAYEHHAGPLGDLAPFCWWAGEAMVRDLAPRVGRDDMPWLTEAHLDRVRRWTDRWRRRAEAGTP